MVRFLAIIFPKLKETIEGLGYKVKDI